MESVRFINLFIWKKFIKDAFFLLKIAVQPVVLKM